MIDRSDLVGARAAGELGFIVAGKGKAGREAFELEVLFDRVFESEALGAGEILANVDSVDVSLFEVPLQSESLATVVSGDLEAGDIWLDLDVLKEMLELEMRGELLVEVDADLAIGVGDGDGAD